MDRAPYTIPLRPEKPAGSRVLIGKGVVLKNLSFVVVDTGDERCGGRNRLAGKFKGTCLMFDHDMVAHIHAARSALPADKHHQDTLNR